jgi:gamma-glutamyltranspeptidase
MQFTYSSKRKWENASRRSVAMGTHGMVASSQHLATLAGYKALAKGGNAVDAAVAMVSTLSVVEPHSVGLGGDAFALIYLAKENKLVGMNGSGRAPYRATIDWFKNHGMMEIPERGILSATVPEGSWMEPGSSYRTEGNPSHWIPNTLTALSRIRGPCTRLSQAWYLKTDGF